MFTALLAKIFEPSSGEHFLLSGLLFFLAPLLGLGLPLLALRFIDKEVRGVWARGMITIAFPALIVCVLVASNYAPIWSEKQYVKTGHNAAELERDTQGVGDIIVRTIILAGGTASLIILGGFANSKLQKEEE